MVPNFIGLEFHNSIHDYDDRTIFAMASLCISVHITIIGVKCAICVGQLCEERSRKSTQRMKIESVYADANGLIPSCQCVQKHVVLDLINDEHISRKPRSSK